MLVHRAIKTLPGWSPDSRKLAVGIADDYTTAHALGIVDLTTGEVEEVGVQGVGASGSPNGKFIACTTDVIRGGRSYIMGIPRGGKLGIYNVQQRKMRLIEGTDGAMQPAWSKDGNLVAYCGGGG